jgi:hypothetical protein
MITPPLASKRNPVKTYPRKNVPVLFPHRMFVTMILDSTRLHYARPFRPYEPLFIVRA